MACNSSTTDRCDACFNWASGFIQARSLDSSASPADCKSVLGLTVQNCMYYSGTDLNTAAARTVSTCDICKETYLNWTASTNVAICDDTGLSGCKLIENCKTVVCFKPASGATTSGCRMCNDGYYGTSWEAANSTGSTECTKGSGIGNCEHTRQVGTTSHQCYNCKKDYSVDFAQAGCVAWTNDSNCRRLQTGDKTCYYCWHSYFWATDVCKLVSYLTVSVSVAVVGLLGIVVGA